MLRSQGASHQHDPNKPNKSKIGMSIILDFCMHLAWVLSCYIMVRLKIEICQASFKFKDTGISGDGGTKYFVILPLSLAKLFLPPPTSSSSPSIQVRGRGRRSSARVAAPPSRRSVESFLCLAFLDSAGRYSPMMIAAVAAAAFTISGVAFVMGKLPFKFQLSNDPLGCKCRLRYYSARRK